MRRVLSAVLVLFLFTVAALAAGPDQALLDAGRQAYGAGRYQEAATAFVAAMEAAPGLADADLCLDTAMAWRLSGDVGRAAFWLLRAGAVSPTDPAVNKALAAAGLPLPRPGPPLGRLLPPRLVWLVALAANAAFWLGLAWARLAFRPLPRPVLAVGAVLVLWLWTEAAWPTLAAWRDPRGVVLIATPGRSAPEAGAEALIDLAAGEPVGLGPQRQGFVRVETASGRAAWVVRDAIATVPW